MSIVAKRLDGMDKDGTCHEGGPRSRPHCARRRPSYAPQKGGRAPPRPTIFGSFLLWPNGWSGCIKMPLGREVCLGRSDFVLDGDPAPPYPKRGRSPPIFAQVYCAQTAGCIKMPFIMEVGLRFKRLCHRWGPSSPPPKRGGVPQFRPMSVVAKWLHGLRCHLVLAS